MQQRTTGAGHRALPLHLGPALPSHTAIGAVTVLLVVLGLGGCGSPEAASGNRERPARIVLRSDGLAVVAIGEPAEVAVRELTERLGAIVDDTGWQDGECRPRERHVRWDDLELHLGRDGDDTEMLGYAATAPFATSDGVRGGETTFGEMLARYDPLVQEDGSGDGAAGENGSPEEAEVSFSYSNFSWDDGYHTEIWWGGSTDRSGPDDELYTHFVTPEMPGDDARIGAVTASTCPQEVIETS